MSGGSAIPHDMLWRIDYMAHGTQNHMRKIRHVLISSLGWQGCACFTLCRFHVTDVKITVKVVKVSIRDKYFI